MKIKTKALSYDEVMALPRPEHKPPQKPNPLLRLGFRLASAPDLKATRFSYTTEDMEKLGALYRLGWNDCLAALEQIKAYLGIQ